MPITVEELVAIPYLRTQVLAGAGGVLRPVTWAHSIEVDEPWLWVEPGDLIMTVGLGVPAAPQDQVTYVRELARIGASGVAIGAFMQAPPLSDAMLAAADEVRLPLLSTAFEVPFIQMSRAVASANGDAEHRRLVQVTRIYDRLRTGVSEQAPAALIDTLADEIECAMWVCSSTDPALCPLPDGESLPDDVRACFAAAAEGHGPDLPAILRGGLPDGRVMLAVPVPTTRAASLVVAVPVRHEAPPYAVLQHVATAVALELERAWSRREELRRYGSEALGQLVDRRMDPDEAAHQLGRQGLRLPLYFGLIQRDGGLEDHGWLHHALADRRIPNMLLRRDDLVHCLLPATPEAVAACAAMLTETMRMGLSDPIAELRELPAATVQAHWALDAAEDAQHGIARYGDRRSEFGPRSVAEARLAVDRVLGTLLAHDRGRGADLVPTLQTFLRCNRSWLRASNELFIHKQTLVHRIRRIEQITGRSLSDTGDVSELWLAVEAWRRLRSGTDAER